MSAATVAHTTRASTQYDAAYPTQKKYDARFDGYSFTTVAPTGHHGGNVAAP